MRLKSEIIVSALVRRVFAQGAFAAVLHKGSAEAGAIFVRQRGRSGLETLYGPAPQSLVDPQSAGARLFEVRAKDADASAVDDLLSRELRFDPDCWVVEIEIDAIGDLLEITPPA